MVHYFDTLLHSLQRKSQQETYGMNIRHKLTYLCFGLLLLVVAACSDTQPIIVGFSGQLTGKMSDLGVHGRNGVQLAMEMINAEGGINGRKLQLIAKDDGGTPEKAQKADRALIEAGAVAIIGHMTSSQTLAALPVLNDSSTIMISPTSSSSELSKRKDKFFRVIVDSAIRSRELADYARSALNIKSVVTIADTTNSSYSLTFINSFTEAMKKMDGETVRALTYSSDQKTNWDKIIQIIAEANPDGVVLACPAQDVVALAQRIHAANLNVRILSAGWAYTERLLIWGGEDVEDIIFVIDYAADNPKPEFVKFKEQYKQRFGSVPNFASAFAYEAMLALASALKKTDGSAKGLTIALAPSNIIPGVIGDFTLNAYGDVKRNVFITTIHDGEFRTVEMR